MKLSLRFLALVAFAALPVLGRAQTTYHNINDTGKTAIQTFSGFESIDGMTWTLKNTGGNLGSLAVFSGYIAEWDTGSNKAIGTAQAFSSGAAGLFFVPADDFATVNFTFDDSFALNSSTTYALILSYASGDNVFSAEMNNPGDTFFGSGFAAGFANTSSNILGFEGFLEGTGAASMTAGASYTMSIDGIAASPAPEPAAAAVGIAAAFVSMLVGRRIRQRRALAAAPLAA